jgi:hypothetical protein
MPFAIEEQLDTVHIADSEILYVKNYPGFRGFEKRLNFTPEKIDIPDYGLFAEPIGRN